MSKDYKIWSGQINYKSIDNASSYYCVVIKDGVFHNLSEEIRLDMIEHLKSLSPEPTIDLEDMLS